VCSVCLWVCMLVCIAVASGSPEYLAGCGPYMCVYIYVCVCVRPEHMAGSGPYTCVFTFVCVCVCVCMHI